MKNTGAATVATVFAWHGFKSEVVASESGCPMLDVIVGQKIRYVYDFPAAPTLALCVLVSGAVQTSVSDPASTPDSIDTMLTAIGAHKMVLNVHSTGCRGNTVPATPDPPHHVSVILSPPQGEDKTSAGGTGWSCRITVDVVTIFATGAPCPTNS